MAQPNQPYVLVTGATGFIGAHIVDGLLEKGAKVRGATRSLAKGETMIKARPEHAGDLEFVQINDFENPGGLEAAVKDVDAIVHTASPFTYDTANNEKELIIPAINGVRAVFSAAATNPKIRRIVLTSSFASVMDADRKAPPFFTYTGEDWNPLSYKTAADPATSAVIAYRGSKKFAEAEAWKFLEENKPGFDLVALCPPMTFGPVVHPVASVDRLNESNAMLWRIASGQTPLPVSRVPFWIDVRDLAAAHVRAVLNESKGSKRYTVSSPEHFNYGLAAKIMNEEFPELKGQVALEEQHLDESYGLDGTAAARALGFEYRPFHQTVRSLIHQALRLDRSASC